MVIKNFRRHISDLFCCLLEYQTLTKPSYVYEALAGTCTTHSLIMLSWHYDLSSVYLAFFKGLLLLFS